MAGVQKLSVNVLNEIVQVHINPSQITIDEIKNHIQQLKFQIVKEPEEIVLQNSNEKRAINFIFEYIENEKIPNGKIEGLNQVLNNLGQIVGIKQAKILYETRDYFALNAEYIPSVLKGSDLLEDIQEHYTNIYNIKVVDKYLDQFSKKHQNLKSISTKQLLISLLLISIFLIFVLVLPRFNFFDKVYIFPFDWDIASIYMLGVLSITIFTFKYFGISCFYSAYINYTKHRILNMETLITLGSISSFAMGIFLIIMYLVQNQSDDKLQKSSSPSEEQKEDRISQIEMIVHMFEGASLIILIVIIGKYLEGKAKETIIKMTEDLFPESDLIKNKYASLVELQNRKFKIRSEKQTEISLIEKNDIIKIKEGDKLLVDGIIVSLQDTQLKAIDSVCYGWDTPFEAKVGDRIKSGATIIEGTAILQIENTIENSMLYKISNQLNMAQNDQDISETGVQRLFKLLSDYFVKIVILAALLVMVIWIVLIATDAVDISQHCVYCVPFMRSISVLVASCPCALGLAIPSVISITLNLAMKNNILIKKNSIFEKIQNVQSVIFDKTGTLFTKLEKIADQKLNDQNNKYNLQLVWEIINIIEKDSRHPLAELLFKESMKHANPGQINQNFSVNKLEYLKNGVKAALVYKQDQSQRNILFGNVKLLEENNVQLDEQSKNYIYQQSKQGNTCLSLAINNQIIFQISLDNTSSLRQESRAVVAYLQKQLKKDVFILSGDAKETVQKVGQHLDIPQENLIGETDSQSKQQLIKGLKDKTGKEVMMIGDGLNDILGIQEAGIGVTINAKSEMNLIASDIVALNENLWKIVSLFKLISYSKIFIYMNLLWASAYNIIMLPIAAGVFYSFDFTISPTIASAAMSGSSLVVIGFSNFMKCIEFDQSKTKIGQYYMTKYGYNDVFQDNACRKQELINNINIQMN